MDGPTVTVEHHFWNGTGDFPVWVEGSLVRFDIEEYPLSFTPAQALKFAEALTRMAQFAKEANEPIETYIGTAHDGSTMFWVEKDGQLYLNYGEMQWQQDIRQRLTCPTPPGG